MDGSTWGLAPKKWQALDTAYLALDVTVVVGWHLRETFGVIALVAAAANQSLLYTLFRSWVLDVPVAFEVGPSEAAYLDGLLLFHAACLLGIGIVVSRRLYSSISEQSVRDRARLAARQRW